ncbi:MAG: thiolase family protein [Pseudomonadota bacterium]|nr:thiolase family protein [Pseudomonadota bacterium]
MNANAASRRAVIVDVVRSPFGRAKQDGALAAVHPVDLLAQVLDGLVDRTGIDPSLVEDVITGCVIQVAEQSANIGRQAVLAAGFPESVPAVTLDRKCGSAQQAMDFAAQGVIAGAYDVVIASGVEMMSLVPMRVNRMGKDNLGGRLRARYPAGMVNQGISAELIADKWRIDRESMDRFSVQSHVKASQAIRVVGRDIVPIKTDNGEVVFEDEGLRPDSSLDKLANLKPAFCSEEMQVRFPHLSWTITAGNSSQISDGASAMLIVEEKTAERLGLNPRAAITHFATVGDDPIMMLTAIIPATQKVLKRAGLSLDSLDAYEVNEAFASIPLAWQKELGADPDKLNCSGGAIALGHPVGASGGRLVANLLSALEANNGLTGLVTMCESGGMANATVLQSFC